MDTLDVSEACKSLGLSAVFCGYLLEPPRDMPAPVVSDDGRPNFKDPQPLGFDPEEACRRDDGKGEEGVKFREVWRDPLTRTLWIAIKARHLTNQHFRQNCITQAEWIRARPPKTANDLSCLVFDLHPGLGGRYSLRFHVQLYPYVVRCLIDENNWPYLMPPGVPAKTLGWIAK